MDVLQNWILDPKMASFQSNENAQQAQAPKKSFLASDFIMVVYGENAFSLK